MQLTQAFFLALRPLLQLEDAVLVPAQLPPGALQFIAPGGGLPLGLGLPRLGLFQGGGKFLLLGGELLQLVGAAPAERLTEPPVMEPPGLSTCPSRVTILKRWP